MSRLARVRSTKPTRRSACSARRFAFEPLEERALLSHAPGLGYSFQPVAFLGDPAPGGGVFINDFELYGINNRGEVSFTADVSNCEGGFGFCEGYFRGTTGSLAQITRTGEPVPGGGTVLFSAAFPQGINDHGDLAVAVALDPFGGTAGANTGLYRYSSNTQTLTPVVLPGVTPVPGGGAFVGGGVHSDINNRGDIVFPGMVPTDDGIHIPGEPDLGLGIGIFRQSKDGKIVALVAPGDPAPGAGTFDFARMPRINDAGDLAFFAHLAGEPCDEFPGTPQADFIHCLNAGLYVRDAATGEIQSIVQPHDPAIGERLYPFGAVINSRGQIAFTASNVNPDFKFPDTAVFFHANGTTTPVALPGDAMPGGGRVVRTGVFIGALELNERGEVAFDATLDTDENADGFPDSGLYVWVPQVGTQGTLHLIARTGTVIPGVGTIAHFATPGFLGALPAGLPRNNDGGQVFFQATLEDGTGVLLIATPMGEAAGSSSAASAGSVSLVVVTSGLQTASPSPLAPTISEEASAPLAGQPPAPATTNPSTPRPPQAPPLPLETSSDHGFAHQEDFLLDESLLNDLAAGLLGWR
ncbi:MAG: hypothetical protein HY000_38370 [Planctomycetes bacterium]|nr:hypothetical protein [Planctomycetota bacterium]